MTEISETYVADGRCHMKTRIEYIKPVCPDCGAEYMPVLYVGVDKLELCFEHTCPEPEQ